MLLLRVHVFSCLIQRLLCTKIDNSIQHSMDVELGSPTKNRARRRRKKEVANPSAFHHTFVMKLFDR